MKRGQVTVFVIVGALILLSVGLVLVTTRDIAGDDPGLDTNDVSLESRPVVDYITNCLRVTSEEALIALGRQGGLLNPPGVSAPSYRSEAVLYSPDTIPYWRYLGACSTNGVGCEMSNQPPLCKPGSQYCVGLTTTQENLPSIEEQLETFVEEEIVSCIDGFASFSVQYDIKEEAKPDVSLRFGDEETSFVLDYPIVITSLQNDNTKQENEYSTTFDVPLKKMYGTAESVIDFSRQTNYYEQTTMQLINTYADVENILPPTSSFELSGRYGPWIQPVVKDAVQYDLLPFMDVVNFVNAPNFKPIRTPADDIEEEYQQYVQGINEMFTPVMEGPQLEYDIDHIYTYDDIFLQINDGKTVIKAEPLIELGVPLVDLVLSGIKDYRFKYYVSYPLVVQVTDPTAFNNEGYTFQFAYEVNIRANKPGYGNFTSVNTGQRFIDPSINNYEVILPQNITIKTINKRTGEPVTDIPISYYCGDTYEVGFTELNGAGDAVITSQLPYCEIGGFLVVESPEYYAPSQNFDNLLDGTDTTVEIEVWPRKTKEIVLRKRSVSDLELLEEAGTDLAFAINSLHSPINESEEVLVSVEKIVDSIYEAPVPYVGFGVKSASQNFFSEEIENLLAEGLNQDGLEQETYDSLSELQADFSSAEINFSYESVEENITMDFIPGTYTVDLTMLNAKGLYLPAATFTADSGLPFGIKDEEVPLPEQNFSRWVTGVTQINMTMTESDVYNDEPIVLYVLEMPLPADWFELLGMPEFDEYNEKYLQYARPDFGYTPRNESLASVLSGLNNGTIVIPPAPAANSTDTNTSS
jgi:hypothetical protein